MSELILALDIGGTKLAAGIAPRAEFAKTGQLTQVIKEPTPAPGTPQAVIPRAVELGRQLAATVGGTVRAIGISTGGPLDHLTGVVINFPHLPGWRQVALCDEVGAAFAAPALLDNDANLGALAEHRWGAGRGYQDLVYLTISTGIGGGVIVGGQLVHGVGSAAGEVGHISVETGGRPCACGSRGCLEALASGTAIARRAREQLAAQPGAGRLLLELAGGDPARITAELVYQAARQGDEPAAVVWRQTAEYMAVGLSAIIHVLAPPLIILGGGVAQAGEGLLGPIRECLKRHVFYVPLERVALVSAALGHDSALLGAATLALNARS